MDYSRQKILIRRWLIFFIIALALSGSTAFALETELHFLLGLWPDQSGGAVHDWIQKTYDALKDANVRYPFLAYGYDWLAFAHFVIAIAFIGPFLDPVRNKWVIQFGMISCILVFPLAFIAGGVRGIPVYWRLIDCSFRVLGLIPLSICLKKIGLLENLRPG